MSFYSLIFWYLDTELGNIRKLWHCWHDSEELLLIRTKINPLSIAVSSLIGHNHFFRHAQLRWLRVQCLAVKELCHTWGPFYSLWSFSLHCEDFDSSKHLYQDAVNKCPLDKHWITTAFLLVLYKILIVFHSWDTWLFEIHMTLQAFT